MIEEAAGTRMYESKKQQAVKTMEKKQSKLNEIEAVCCHNKSFSYFYRNYSSARKINISILVEYCREYCVPQWKGLSPPQ